MDETYLERRLQKLEDGVEEYLRDQRMILEALKDLKAGVGTLGETVNAIDKRLAMQEVRSGLIGGLGGGLVMAVKWFLTGSAK